MDELGFNKIAGAILATALGVMVLREVPHFFMHTDAPETPVYSVGAIEMGSGDEEALDLPFPQQSWVDAMDADEGAKVFKKCQSCHNVEAGGPNGTGPNLYGVVGGPTAHKSDFNYSSAMASAGYDWTYEQLDGFLTRPAAHLSGTNMSFIGLKKEEDRAAVIEYLRVNAASPLPKPEAQAAPEEEPTEMAEGEEGPVVDEDGEAVEANVGTPVADPTNADSEGDAPAADENAETSEDESTSEDTTSEEETETESSDAPAADSNDETEPQ